MSDWSTVNVRDVAVRVTKGTTPTTLGGKFVDEGIHFVKVESITDEGRIDASRLAFIDEASHAMLSRSILEEDDVLFTIAGTIGRVAQVPKSLLPANTNQAVAIIRPNCEVIDPRFLYYALRDEQRVMEAHSRIVQSVQANFSLSELAGLEIPFPEKDKQQEIVEILGTLDDKVELNRRTIRTLEEMARATFNSWFVDFDPVRAKLEGHRPYGMDAETAQIFPNSFDESSPELTPFGWKSGSIAEIATYVNGRNFTKDATGSGRMVIRIAELNSGPGRSTVFNEVDAQPENIAHPGDILFAWSGSLGVYRWHRDEALINQHIFKVICAQFPNWFVFYQLQESIDYFREIASHKATTMGHIKRGHLDEVAVALPPEELLTEASKIIDPIYRRIHLLERESQVLAGLRDTLLPKLISGEVRIREAEQMAEAAL